MSTKNNSDDDLAPTTTEGYKPPVARPLNELKDLDANDESLKRWKESLLKNSTATDSKFASNKNLIHEK